MAITKDKYNLYLICWYTQLLLIIQRVAAFQIRSKRSQG